MSSRLAASLLCVAGLALAALVAFAWLDARKPPARELGALELGAAPETARGSRPAESELTVPAVGTAPASPERTDAAPAQELLGEVRAVLEPDGRPAAGADVWWFDGARLADPRCRADLDLLGLGREFLERHGRRFAADHDGVARVPLATDTVQVVAATATHFGMTTLERRAESSEPIVVALREAFGIDVLVRSAVTREPQAAVAVAAACVLLPESKVGGLTDARGVARVWPLFREAEPRGSWSVRVPGVFREELRVPFALEPRAEPLEIVLPESRAVRVRVVGERGEVVVSSGVLRIAWKDAEGDPVEPARAWIVDGVASLSRVEVGVTVYVQAEIGGVEEKAERSFVLEGAGRGVEVVDLLLRRG